MKKALIAAAVAALLKETRLPEPEIVPTRVLRQHPSLRRGKSGAAAAKRAAQKRKAKRR